MKHQEYTKMTEEIFDGIEDRVLVALEKRKCNMVNKYVLASYINKAVDEMCERLIVGVYDE